MRSVPVSITQAWYSGEFVGDTRPMARVTIQKPQMQLHQTGDNLFANYILSAAQGVPKELPNVLSVAWSRDVDTQVSDCTIELLNTAPLPIGQAPPTADFDLLGHYTPQRGATSFSSRWNHTPNEWSKVILPENIIRTYEGYGFDDTVCPSQDPNLVQTGVWWIEEVEFTHDGRITITCTDLAGPLLTKQIAFPPVVPFRAGPRTTEAPDGKYAYPVQFQSVNPAPLISTSEVESVSVEDAGDVPTALGGSSNDPYISSQDATYRGHRASEAFDDDPDTYWLSVGNARNDQGYSYEWIEADIGSTSVQSISFRTKGTGYTVYVGIYANGAWQGSATVPYDPNNPVSAPNGADEKYVKSLPALTENEITVTLPQTYTNVTKVRLTFGNLWNSGLSPYPYRAAVRELSVSGRIETTTTQTVTNVTTFDLKNYDDYTDIVKLFCAWGGFFWPSGAYELDCNGAQQARSFTRVDNCLTINGAGRVWGDFKISGTAGPITLGIENFEKKPLLDCINYVADIVGFIFYIDETGGAVFRPPNVYQLGNLQRSLSRAAGQRTPDIVELDERTVLEGLSSKLSAADLREQTFVANTDGTLGALVDGWNANATGLRRVGGWTDQNFSTQAEVRIMAEMISLRQVFTYRRDQVTIRGNPQIQVDDQVRISERVTSEGYIHYVRGITSNNDLRTGEWSYELATNWLGEQPFARWAFDESKLTYEARIFLQSLYGRPEETI